MGVCTVSIIKGHYRKAKQLKHRGTYTTEQQSVHKMESGDSFCDRLCSRYTPLALIGLAALLCYAIHHEGFGDRITCWTPAQFTETQAAFAHEVSLKKQ